MQIHEFKPGPEQPGRGVRCVEGLSRDHGGVSCGRPEGAPIHQGIGDSRWTVMIPDPHPLENCGPLRFRLVEGESCPTCGTVVAAPQEMPVPERATNLLGEPMWLHPCGRVAAGAGCTGPGCHVCGKVGGWRALYTLRGDA